MANRLNVYVPDDLKRRMGKAKDVNWSGVACEAFERKLGELAAKKTEKNMDDVVQRLRASNLEDTSKIEKLGREAGVEWAKRGATAAQLKRLERATEEREGYPNDGPLFLIPEGNAYSGAEVFWFTIEPDESGSRSGAADFWRDFADEGIRGVEDEFVQAFAEGAVELWREVKGKI